MATTDLMIPSKADVPAYVLNPEAARAANEEAAAGISTGYPARIKLGGGKFILVDGNGEDTAFPASKLFIGPDENQYLPLIILRARKALQKSFYLLKYNPNASEFVPPDCFSNDSERPDPTSPSPQSDLCATCPNNAFGSGKDQDGNATKGKACADNKILAAFVPSFGVHQFKIPPGSLKNFGLYVKQLSAAGIPLGTVKTLVGFDPTVTTSLLVFKYGGFISESLLPKLAELSASLEVEEILAGQGSSVSAPKLLEEKPPADDLGLADAEAKKVAAAEVAAKKKAAADAAAKKKAAADAAAKKKVDDRVAAEAQQRAQAAAEAAAAVSTKTAAEITDAELAAELGL